MAIRINFDTDNNPELPTFVLSNRVGDKIGLIDHVEGVNVSGSLKDANSIVFTVNKYDNGKECPFWDKMVDFKLVHCKEWDTWFQLHVTYTDDKKITKKMELTALGEAETSQLILYDYEINTETDIARDDYSPTIFYNEEDPSCSLLDRLLKVAPHYSIEHVDDRLKKIQRSFSWNGTSLCDAFREIEEEIGCIFIFNNGSNTDGSIKRSISVYDTQAYCLDCGFRGEYLDECPECGSKNVLDGYGKDTTICFTTEDLADTISIDGDVNSMKNCFRLIGGDDLFTATVRDCLLDSSGYYWYITDDMKEDMPVSLVEKLNEYEETCEYYQNEHTISVPSDLLAKWNDLTQKYSAKKTFEVDMSNIVGFSSISKALYEAIDFSIFLSDGMLPEVEALATTAEKEASVLTVANLSPVSVKDASYFSLSTANSAVLSMAKAFVNPNYQVKINSSSLNGTTWTGNFIVTSYYDEEDTAVSNVISITLNDEYETYINQTLAKILAAKPIEDTSITGLFSLSLDEFTEKIKEYNLSALVFLSEACQSCLDVMIQNGLSDPDSWVSEASDLYTILYQPYKNKYNAILAEISVREEEVAIVDGTYNFAGELQSEGVRTFLEKERQSVRNSVNMEQILGTDLWKQLYIYRREDTYENTNYISEGLTTAELFERATQFVNNAISEIHRASIVQKTITAKLKNLLVIKEFAPLRDYFECGNWLRAKVDGKIHKFRLIDYEIAFDNLQEMSVSFSNIVAKAGAIDSLRDTLGKASSMATSYNATKAAASKGAESQKVIAGWYSDGMAMTTMKIVNDANNQNIVYDSHGLLFREKDELLDKYSPIQLKIINSTLAITDDEWETTKAAIGKFYYRDPITGEYKMAYGINGELLVGKLILGEQLGLYNSGGTMSFDENGLKITNGTNTVIIDPNSENLFVLKNETGNIMTVTPEGEIELVVKSLKIGKSNIASEEYVDAKIEDSVVYKLEIMSSNGMMFTNSVINTVLTPVLYKGSENVTDNYDDSYFVWHRISNDTSYDEYWDSQHAPTKSLRITSEDVSHITTFRCDFTVEDTVVASSTL